MLFFTWSGAFCQDKSRIDTLISEGIKLHDQAKYQEAIAKYKEVLAIDPDNSTANYEIAFTLFTTNAANDAISYLNKVIQTGGILAVGAYDMLGSIADQQGQSDKAIEYFQQGLKMNPKYQRIYFNLAVTYGRIGKDKEALENVTRSLQLNPKHASSHRLYAILARKNSALTINALLAYCNFLMLEVNTERSVAAYNEVKSILSAGITKSETGAGNIVVADAKDPDFTAANLAIGLASTSAAAIPGLNETERLEQQLKNVFSIVGGISAKRKDKDFFWLFYADYFSGLSKSEFMPLLSHIVTFTADRDGHTKWITEHQQQLGSFSAWEKANPRIVGL